MRRFNNGRGMSIDNLESCIYCSSQLVSHRSNVSAEGIPYLSCRQQLPHIHGTYYYYECIGHYEFLTEIPPDLFYKGHLSLFQFWTVVQHFHTLPKA